VKITLYLLGSSAAFFLGMVIAHYQVFPYPQLQAFKQIFFPINYETLEGVKYRERKISSHAKLAGQSLDLLFVGDSLIAEADWASYFYSYKVANLGINSDTTEGLIERVSTVKDVNAAKIFLMIGVNDIFQKNSISSIQTNYQKIVAAVKKENNKVYIFSCLHVGPSYQQHNKEISRLNVFLKDLAEGLEGVFYVDLNSVLALDSRLNPTYTNDDVHLNGDAYELWKNVIAEVLDKKS